MAKIDLDSFSIEDLAKLRDDAAEKLAEKVALRQAELEAELAELARYGKVAKKPQGLADARPKKDSVKDGAKEHAVKEHAVKAA